MKQWRGEGNQKKEQNSTTNNARHHEKNVMKMIMKDSPPLDYTYNKTPRTNQRMKIFMMHFMISSITKLNHNEAHTNTAPIN